MLYCSNRGFKRCERTVSVRSKYFVDPSQERFRIGFTRCYIRKKKKRGIIKPFFFCHTVQREATNPFFPPLLCIAHFKLGPLVWFGEELLLDFADEPKNWRLAKTKNEMSLIQHIPFGGRIITQAF